MKKLVATAAAFLAVLNLFGAELKAKNVTAEAARKQDVDQAIHYLKNQVSKITEPSERRAVYIFMASLQEQLSLYGDAQISYASAASSAALEAEDMPTKSNAQLVLDAVRCALSGGDADTADSYLNSAVRNSKNPRVQAYIKLYSQWSKLCRAQTAEDLQEPILLLQAYRGMESMSYVQPAVLLTLWYLTGDKSYSVEITGRYPKSMEAAVVNGDVQLLPTPFWFFVPKKGVAEQGTGSYAVAELPKDEQNADGNGAITLALPESVKDSAKNEGASASASASKLQLGLFRTQSNADALSSEVNKKGFNSYVTSETRSSGTTYYLVLVNDSDGSVADKLRNNGYECYVVE